MTDKDTIGYMDFGCHDCICSTHLSPWASETARARWYYQIGMYDECGGCIHIREVSA